MYILYLILSTNLISWTSSYFSKKVKQRLIKFICMLDLNDFFLLRSEGGQIRLLEWFCSHVFARIISKSVRS